MLVPMRAILDAADKNDYAQGAFNVNAVCQAKAVINVGIRHFVLIHHNPFDISQKWLHNIRLCGNTLKCHHLSGFAFHNSPSGLFLEVICPE